MERREMTVAERSLSPQPLAGEGTRPADRQDAGGDACSVFNLSTPWKLPGPSFSKQGAAGKGTSRAVF